jgi:hypothetical protein
MTQVPWSWQSEAVRHLPPPLSLLAATRTTATAAMSAATANTTSTGPRHVAIFKVLCSVCVAGTADRVRHLKFQFDDVSFELRNDPQMIWIKIVKLN